MWPGTGVGISQIAIHLAKAWSRQEEGVVAERGTVLLWCRHLGCRKKDAEVTDVVGWVVTAGHVKWQAKELKVIPQEGTARK